MKLGKEIPINEFNKWLRNLRNGKFQQTRSCLQDYQGYCCLGVACKVLLKDLEREDGLLTGDSPIDQASSPPWLKAINSDFKMKTGFTLMNLNDRDGFTFDEIADLLEAVYVYRVLE